MTRDLDVLRLTLDVYEARLVADDHLPDDQRRKLARAAAERVLDAGAPGAVAWLERSRPRTVVDELKRPRLVDRARPYIDAVLRDANVDGDVTERMLLTSAIPWVVPHRDRLAWLLSREAGMGVRDVGLVLGMCKTAAAVAVRRHEGRGVAAKKDAVNALDYSGDKDSTARVVRR